jgi:hypothetical protein
LTLIKRLVIYYLMARPADPQTHARLVGTGGDLVRRQGFHAIGVQDVATAAGVPKGSFYNYFATKEGFGPRFWTPIGKRSSATIWPGSTTGASIRPIG